MAQVATVKFLWRIVDLIVGGVFVYAGAIKALDPVQFAHDIDNYKILPCILSAVAGNLLRNRAYPAASLSRRIVDLSRTDFSVCYRNCRSKSARAGHHVRLFWSCKQELELLHSSRTRSGFVRTRDVPPVRVWAKFHCQPAVEMQNAVSRHL